jgi:hypothetical protein
MPTLVIRDVSPEVHRLLKDRAAQHHRSLSKEVITILEDSVTPSVQALPPLVKGTFPVIQDWLDQARRTGRELGHRQMDAPPLVVDANVFVCMLLEGEKSPAARRLQSCTRTGCVPPSFATSS